MNNYQVLHYHFTVPTKEISFLEVSNEGNLIEEINIPDAIKEALEHSLHSLLDFLKNKNEVLAYFSASFLEVLEKEYPAELEKIKGHVDSGKIELVASCAYHSFSYLCHAELFKKEVEFHKNAYKKHFNKAAELFINTAGLFNDQLINHLSDQGFKGLIAPANSWHLNGVKSSDSYQTIGEKPMKILLSNGDSSSSTYVGLVNGFGSGYDDKELLSLSIKGLKKILSSTTKKGEYSASMPLNSPEWSQPLAQYLSGSLQKALLDECKRLINKTHDQLSDEDWKVIMLICQPDKLLQLNTNLSSDGFQHFINCMNLLTAIGLRYR
ncbi:polysaccharide deacetylase family protein [Fulvivirga lutea]|uniref:Glycoside hydrolase family 57 N-terminal domain-containing protein n=1 Tax=Fulvivirga lutea TaxID=2810512 RepID=A0A974WIH2_9BACT|nr:hypothetical protein [Fulvivirga lutea]QSE99163.1 hypothetical protein JR347_08760 [Fulvivirga lutea]